MNDPYAPRREPEIIPPGEPLPRRSDAWTRDERHATHYVYAGRIGPVTTLLLALGVGAVAGLAFLFVLGAALIGLVSLAVLIGGAAIAGLLRKPHQPLR
ncbi:MAG TPA: hypothetical protein VMB84_01300 [Stellaceae bacterium]|nr:hypothetical protein [Stellaceae bacterium]